MRPEPACSRKRSPKYRTVAAHRLRIVNFSLWILGEPFALANGFSLLTVPLRAARTRLLTQAARRSTERSPRASTEDRQSQPVDSWRAVRVSERVLAIDCAASCGQNPLAHASGSPKYRTVAAHRLGSSISASWISWRFVRVSERFSRLTVPLRSPETRLLTQAASPKSRSRLGERGTFSLHVRPLYALPVGVTQSN